MTRFYVRVAGNNDFYNTVRAFMEAIAPRVLLGGEWKDITKEQIVALFNKHNFSMYALHQHHKLQIDAKHEAHMRIHLEIGVKDVYFDEEIDAFDNQNGDGCIATEQHDGIGYYMM